MLPHSEPVGGLSVFGVLTRGVADAADKENQLTQTLSRLFALAENYPNLKANESVKALMEELSSTENKIGFARQFYNDIATRFNTAQQVFPDNLIAQAFKFQPVELFEIKDAAERDGPPVDLDLRPTTVLCSSEAVILLGFGEQSFHFPHPLRDLFAEFWLVHLKLHFIEDVLINRT